jgi:DNA-binding NarL/FixJ family response regulator
VSTGNAKQTTETATIRVVIAEDHHVVRAAVAAMLTEEPDIEVVGEVAESDALLPTIKRLGPDLLLLDAHMPGHKVVRSARLLRVQYPQMPILILSAYKRREYVVELLKVGAAGYVLKDDTPDMLLQAIRAVARGEEWVSPSVTRVLLTSVRHGDEQPLAELTGREMEVLRLVANGRRNEDIAHTLVITEQTVKNHVRNIFRKLNVETRVEAALYAINQGLVQPDR